VPFCHACGYEVKDSWKNCTECGVAVESTSSQDPASFSDLELMQSGWNVQQIYELRHSAESSPIFSPDTIQSSYHDNTTHTCINCGKGLFQGWRKCPHCDVEQVGRTENEYDWDNPDNTNVTYYFAEYNKSMGEVQTKTVKVLYVIYYMVFFAATLLPIMFFGIDADLPLWADKILGIFLGVGVVGLIVWIYWPAFVYGKIDFPRFRWRNVKVGRKKYCECFVCGYHGIKMPWSTSDSTISNHWRINHKKRFYDASPHEIKSIAKHKIIQGLKTVQGILLLIYIIVIPILIMF